MAEHTAGEDGVCTACGYAVSTVAENGFALLSAGKVDYFVGDSVDFSGLSLSVTFTDGKTKSVSAEDVTIDTSAVDMNAAGEYPITVSYSDRDLTYNIYVYALESLKLGFDVVEKIEDATTGNTIYYNHSFKELYFVGEELDTTGLLVTVVAKCGEKTLEFMVDDYTVDYLVFDWIDQYKITIGYADLETEIALWVTDAVPTPNEDGVYWGLVDPEYQGLAGYLSGPYHVFATIQEALDFFATIDPAAQKEIFIAPGCFNEKIEITIPNLKLIGWGDTPADVVIQWDNYCGQTEADGFVHVLDSTATVAIRESAYNVTFEYITVANTHDNQGNNAEAGLALLVQADGFSTADLMILGEQKTK